MEKVLNGKKGQLFIAGAIIILVGLILLKSLFVYSSVEEKRFLESSLLERYSGNIMNEYENIAGLATMQSDVNRSGIDYLSNFSFFITDAMRSKILYAFVFVNSNSYSVTVGNFLGDKINLTINATDSTPGCYHIGVMNHKTNQTREFIADINGTVELTFGYVKSGNEYSQKILIIKHGNQ